MKLYILAGIMAISLVSRQACGSGQTFVTKTFTAIEPTFSTLRTPKMTTGCGDPRHISVANIKPIEYTEGVTDTGDRATVTVICKEGYYFDRPGTQMSEFKFLCLDGHWHGPHRCRKKDCDDFLTKINSSGLQAIRQYNVSWYGDVAFIQCTEGYRTIGYSDNSIVSANFTCDDEGQWRQFLGCELKDCGKPDVPVHGSVDINYGTAYNDTATFSCNSGYTLQGDTTVTCKQTKNWNHPFPSCIINDCGNLTDPSNGSVHTDNGTTYKSEAVYKCDLGFTLNGSSTTHCLANKTWSYPMPKCNINDCGAPIHVQHGTYGELNGTTYLSVTVYACIPGYTFYGNNTSQCLANASWSFVNANCTIKECGERASSTNANISYPNGTVFESTAHVSCIDGYRINGSIGNDNGTETITCTEDGEWSQAHGCDKKDCEMKVSAQNADVIYTNGTLFEDTAEIKCKNGHRVKGSEDNTKLFEYIQCQSSGIWSGTYGCEKKKCSANENSSNASVTYGNNTLYEAIAIVNCDDGYRIIGDNDNNIVSEVIQCQATGSWNSSYGCERKDCSNETHAVNAQVAFAHGTLFESVANVSCFPGYKINGTEGNDNTTTTIHCMTTGTWSGAPVCMRKNCGGNITTPNANVAFGDTYYNENATVSCAKGYKVNLTFGNNVIEETITCHLDGYWANPSGCVKKGNIICAHDHQLRAPHYLF
ncbi:sushi, von Willebrand factor type A, EGF and pentraxin domain-containing protein 1-like [Mya arenaria]|uniref:sushi, von Willebrand factor type A, EGF and pentraxin domain-containing protein 1-like n=1 Tax=Mya arenaria TaxID=6604 RepID=UPI0022E4D1CB|nr:sushi, von Willebrand factor type A, EGF and pentraxin domain-containing protein 1-like [Mya arenaria]